MRAADTLATLLSRLLIVIGLGATVITVALCLKPKNESEVTIK